LHLQQKSPYFSLPPIFQPAPLTKNFPIFLLFPIFHWAKYTLNKIFSVEGKEARNGGENLSQKLGGTSA